MSMRGVLNVALDDETIARRVRERPPAPRHYRRGYGSIYLDQVEQASHGCDFRCLRALDDEAPPDLPLGLMDGWGTR